MINRSFVCVCFSLTLCISVLIHFALWRSVQNTHMMWENILLQDKSVREGRKRLILRTRESRQCCDSVREREEYSKQQQTPTPTFSLSLTHSCISLSSVMWKLLLGFVHSLPILTQNGLADGNCNGNSVCNARIRRVRITRFWQNNSHVGVRLLRRQQ